MVALESVQQGDWYVEQSQPLVLPIRDDGLPSCPPVIIPIAHHHRMELGAVDRDRQQETDGECAQEQDALTTKPRSMIARHQEQQAADDGEQQEGRDA